jgi:hypothetical protein
MGAMARASPALIFHRQDAKGAKKQLGFNLRKSVQSVAKKSATDCTDKHR